MPRNFVSLNSWTAPGFVYQAADAAEVIQGGWRDWGLLRETLARYHQITPDTPHPTGAAVGYFSYEGDFWFGIYPNLQLLPPEATSPLWHFNRQQHEVNQPPVASPWRSNQTEAQFIHAVERAREYIRAGDIYQVNLAQRFTCDFRGNPCTLFEHLMSRSPAPGGAFLDTGDIQILSSSPELFLKIQGRRIATRPIKGTRPRDPDPLRDEQLAFELMTHPKELAELIMITDLERNDLGQISEYGSVVVTDLVRLEKFSHVFHLVSTIEGHLRSDIDTLDAIRACFPGGSITGAPKKRAMEIIRELEPGPRGIYTGAIGYIAFNGDAAFSIAIRTLIREKEQLHFHVGSGITADSVPRAEYEETLHKARGMQAALESYKKLLTPQRRTARMHP